MIDAHCHLDLLDAPIAALDRAEGVEAVVVAGVQPSAWATQIALSRADPRVHIALGLHPWFADQGAVGLADALDQADDIVAIGEIGLDRGRRAAPWDDQVRALRQQLALARARELPVVLHVVRAHDELLRLLRDDGLPRAGGMVHGFSGSAPLAAQYLALGLHLSFGGPLTWPRRRKLHAALRQVPLHRLLVETDAPDQVAEPWRSQGQPGEPAHLATIITAAATLRDEPAATLANATSAQARSLFGL